MKARTIRRLIGATKPPLNIFTSDDKIVYLDHPESALVSDAVVAVAPGPTGPDGVARDLIFINPDHIVRIERTKRKPLRKVA